jgi:hypothetical protein
MGKRGRALIAVAGIALLALLAWTALRAPEPVYQGRPLSDWLARLYTGTDEQARNEATVAVRRIGTNAIPTLLRMLRAHDSPLKTRLLQWARQHNIVHSRYADPRAQNVAARYGFLTLGPSGIGAVPELSKILDQKLSWDSEFWTANSLADMGPGAKEAVPALLRLAMSRDDVLRGAAMNALREIRANPDAVVPAMTKALHDPEPLNQLGAATVLEVFKGDAKPAVPDLVGLLNGTGLNSNSMIQPFVRSAVERALQEIDPETYARVVTNASDSVEAK